MKCSQHDIERPQSARRKVPFSLRIKIQLDGTQHAELFRFRIHLGNFHGLLGELLLVYAARNFESLGVIRNRDVFIAAPDCAFCHAADRSRSIAPFGVHLKVTPQPQLSQRMICEQLPRLRNGQEALADFGNGRNFRRPGQPLPD